MRPVSEKSISFTCSSCGDVHSPLTDRHLCNCGGTFQLRADSVRALRDDISLSLGESVTPLLPAGPEAYYKLDYHQPTGSFKDRGARFMIDILQELGVKKIKEDSSGNAGAATAAYAAAAGMDCEIFLPASASGGKLRQLKAYGAGIERIPGERARAAEAVLERSPDRYYASHVYNPLFYQGVASLAEELIEQLPELGREGRGSIIVPAGNGTLLLGLASGLAEKARDPDLIAVQTSKTAPLYCRYHRETGEDLPAMIDGGKSWQEGLAEGIAIKSPARLEEMLQAVREFEGKVISVNEQETVDTLRSLHRRGIYVESTAAVAAAGFEKIRSGNIDFELRPPVVIPLTGSGLKEDRIFVE